MARFTVYSKDSQSVRYAGEPQYHGSYMGVDYIEFRTIASPVPISWEIGDYVDYSRTGMRYKLYGLPMPKKSARRNASGISFEYSNVQFFAATKELEIAPFRDLVTDDNRIHFSTRPEVATYENVYGIARRIQACMDDLYPGKWRIEVIETDDEDLNALLDETKEFSVSNGSCIDALAQIYELWKNVGWVHFYDSENDMDVITIGYANIRRESNTTDALAYGLGKGLTSIKKASANADQFATRLYVYGSERNIQTRYYNGFDIVDKDSVDIRNLMIPLEKWGKTDGLPDARKAYLQADDEIIEKYGLIPKTIYFDGSEHEEIYPSIVGLTCKKVREAMIEAGEEDSVYLPPITDDRIDRVKSAYGWGDGSKEDTEEFPTFTMYIRQVGFDIATQGRLTSEGHATISMKSGMCAGREFKVKAFRFYVDNNQPELELEKAWDDSIGMAFPNTYYPITEEDEFVLLDIPMPDYYIKLAEDRLYEAAEKLLADYTRVSAFYEPGMDSMRINAAGKTIGAGMYMQVYDEDIVDTADNKDYVLIDTITIDEKSNPPLYSVTLREQKRASRSFGTLEDMIEDAKELSKEGLKKERQYTERRFRSAQETLVMLQAAFKNFSEGISPVTVKTMAMLVGDESLQFRFIPFVGSSTINVNPRIRYDSTTKTLNVGAATRLVHMTLGIESITAPSSRTIDDYLKWVMPAWQSDVLTEGTLSYYLYAKVPIESGTEGEYLLSETSIDMTSEEGYYYFLVGILNSEYNGTREFVSLYGFTEVLPGQITTELIKSADGNAVLDLVNGLLKFGNKVGLSGASSEETNLRMWAGKEESEKESAPFRVYDDGSVYASLLQLLNGCKIGDSIRLEDNSIVVDLPSTNASLKISEQGVEVHGEYGAIIGGCSGAAVQGFAKGAAVFCPNEPSGVGVQGEAKDGEYAFYSLNGVFAGLRPKTRVITTARTSSDPNILDAIDFSVFVNLTSGTCYIDLPQEPLDGQEYYIESRGANMAIHMYQAGYSLYSGNTSAVGYTVTQTGRALLRFKYYKDAGIWVYSWLNR